MPKKVNDELSLHDTVNFEFNTISVLNWYHLFRSLTENFRS